MKDKIFSYENLLQALNNMEAHLLVYDKHQEIIYSNAKFQDAAGFSDKDSIGVSLGSLIEQGYFINSASKEAFRTKQRTIQYIEGKMRTSTLAIATPILDQQGDIIYVVTLSLERDIAEDVSQVLYNSQLQTMQLDYLSKNLFQEDMLIAESPAMIEILTFLSRVSTMNSTILLTGETGTGKEVLAKYIHNNSSQKNKIFLPVNCAAIPENLVESELFGYEAGAFTGAKKEGKPGIFELVDGGTLFLDEIGEMPLPIQSKLLRVLETGRVMRIGAERERKVEFRLVAATNRDLMQMCSDKLFRQDLYYRLSVLSVEIPPLRDRREDIVPLAKFFLAKLNHKYNFSKILSLQAIRGFMDYSWPGNVRELRNVIERMVMVSAGNFLMTDQQFAQTPAPERSLPLKQPHPKEEFPPLSEECSLKEMVDDYEKKLILAALKRNEGNVVKTAAALKVHKTSLYRKLEKYKDPSG